MGQWLWSHVAERHPHQAGSALDMFGTPSHSRGPGEASPILPLFSSLVYYQCLEYEFSPQPDPAPGSEFSLSLRLIIPCPSFIASPLRVGSGSSPPGLHILQIFAAGLFCPESLLDCAEPWARGRACLAAGCSSTGDSWDCPRR